MAETIKTPLVYVSMQDDEQHPNSTRIEYFVDDTPVMDISVDKDVVPLHVADKFPSLVLTQLFVTPHPHLAALADFYAVCSKVDPSSVPVDPEMWSELLQRAFHLLNPGAPPENEQG